MGNRIGRWQLSVLQQAGAPGRVDVGCGRQRVRRPAVGRLIYGSGLRDGDANISTVAPYTQFNVDVAREFLFPLDPKPPGGVGSGQLL